MKQCKSIWLLSAYRSDSHAAWADWLTDTFTEFEWYKLELPGRHFRWRIRGNPLSWLNKLPAKTPDLIIASSMVDLATIRGLHPRIADVPAIYYFHENQFAYPTSEQQHASVDPQMVQLYAALSADYLLFNSSHNRDSFLLGVDDLLNRLPDEVPDNVTSTLKAKSSVLPVPIQPVVSTEPEKPGLILWNHRWEYDKSPETFAAALLELKQTGCEFELALLGDRPQKTPRALEDIRQQLGDHIIVDEKVSREKYEHYLTQASIVVSTAIHEFQGLAMLEAVSAGATPVVPDNLCYPEQYAECYQYKNGNSTALAQKLEQVLTTPLAAPDVTGWYDDALREPWLQVLNK